LSTEQKGQATLLTSVLYIITAITILWLMNYDRLKSIYSSGLLFVFWLLVTLAIVPDVINYSVKLPQQVSHLYEKFPIDNNPLSRSNQ
jgi:membrane protein YdbS with pleckstrin-like domain